MKIPYTEHVTNETVLSRVQGKESSVKSHKLNHFGHTARHNSLAKDIILGQILGKRRQAGQKKQWLDDLKERTDHTNPNLVTLAQDRGTYRRFAHVVAHAR